MKYCLICILLLTLSSCNNRRNTNRENRETDIDSIFNKEDSEYKVLDSHEINTGTLWGPFEKELSQFTKSDYEAFKPHIFERSIPQIQQAIKDGNLTHEGLVLFYLSRIRKYDRENDLSLNAIISLNPEVLRQARLLDQSKRKTANPYSIFGMPVLLKDNINASGMPTTAGAVVFEYNDAEDSFIVDRLQESGALILGKANLSEWAYFFCGDCPSGYSAVGGQTLNPYGRKIHDTGGSSSGSGVAMAANFATAAVGTETSGSILSPSSANSIVGLKPTVGLLSRSGIVPISSTLDTPGPMTRTVIDNAILLDALAGQDSQDPASAKFQFSKLNYAKALEDMQGTQDFLSNKRLGYYKNYMEQDSLYRLAVQELKDSGATLVALEEPEIDLPEFSRVLNLDMQEDLPEYMASYGSKNLRVQDLDEIISFNKGDSSRMMPYGQKLLYGVIEDQATPQEFQKIKDTLEKRGRRFFDQALEAKDLEAVLSINNYMAGYAAVAKYPALTVPMGYTDENRPMGLTFIASRHQELKLLQLAYAYEQLSAKRKAPVDYE